MKKISVLPAKRCGRRLYKMSWYLVLVIIQDDARMCRCINRRRYTVSILGVLFGKTGQYMASFFHAKTSSRQSPLFIEQIGCPGCGINIHKRCAFKPGLQRPWNGAVKYGLTGDAVGADGVTVIRRLRRIQLMTAKSRQIGDADVTLHSGGHGPENVITVENIDVFIDENNVLKLGIGG